MFCFLRLCVGTLVRLLRSRHSLLLENLALRQQLVVLKRRYPRPKLNLSDKLFWLLANSASSIVAMFTSALSGQIAMHRQRYAEAQGDFERAVAAQDALNFNGPPDWPQSMRLYLGAALLKAGRPKEAQAVYRQELHYLYENGWALFGLWQSLRDQGHAEEAQEIQERFKRAWKNADAVLSASVF